MTMGGIFLNLLNISITAGWLILAVILLRFLFKKAPKISSRDLIQARKYPIIIEVKK